MALPVLELLHGPVEWTVFIILVHLGSKPVHKPEWMEGYLDHGPACADRGG